jgi:putative transposase
VKFHFVEKYKDQFRIRSMCRVLGVSRSGFYAWSGRPLPRRETRNEALVVQIRETFRRSRGPTGPRGFIERSRRSACRADGTGSPG